MRDVNQCEFTGNLTRDPELRYTNSGTAIADVGLAVSDSYKKDDEWVNSTVFLNLQAWNKLAERMADRYKKGDRILVKAKFKLDTWEDKTTGEKRSAPKFTILDEWPMGRVKFGENSTATTVTSAEVVGEEDDEDIPF